MLTFNRADEFNRDKFVLYKITCLIFTICRRQIQCEFLITGYELQFDISRYDWRKYSLKRKTPCSKTLFNKCSEQKFPKYRYWI